MPKYTLIPDEVYSDEFIAHFETVLELDENGCFNCTLRQSRGEYIAISVNGRYISVHRAAYAIYHSADPGDMMVCHRCDNPRCCNPKHLFLGTNSDNQVDSLRKGRNSRSRFTDGEVAEVFELYSTGKYRMDELGSLFGVSGGPVSNILGRRSYKHVRIDRKLQRLCDIQRFKTY